MVGLFVATLKSLSRQTCLCWFHFSSIFCRKKNFFLYSVYYHDINLIIETKLYCYLIIIETEIYSFNSSLCHNILFCVATFILQFFSSFVMTIDFFVVTYFTSTLCCFCRDIKLLYRDKVVLPSIAYSEFFVTIELSFVLIDFFCYLQFFMS